MSDEMSTTYTPVEELADIVRRRGLNDIQVEGRRNAVLRSASVDGDMRERYLDWLALGLQEMHTRHANSIVWSDLLVEFTIGQHLRGSELLVARSDGGSECLP